MVDLELLRELVAFQEYGTLSAAAEHLMITQPTVTRKMKKLEQELGVTLFDRQFSNHIALNDTGVLAANEARKVLQAEDNFTETVLNYDRLKHTITIAGVIPGPPQFIAGQEQLPEKVVINHNLIQPDDVLTDLRTRKERLIFTIQDVETDDIESMYLGREYLSVGIDKFNPLAQKKQLSFADLAGMSFLVVQDIGPWRKVVEDNIPDATFLYQEDLKAMSQISQYSNFPFFFTNLTQATPATESRFGSDNRNAVAIDDPHNHFEVYGTYLKSERRNIQPLLKELIKKWPK
ncbi:MAG: LysR family transcriptional regulator [Lactobacillaceae bacterium]|nr:LysR family transcriptional regulator [Lactobacillaceae bacterium]